MIRSVAVTGKLDQAEGETVGQTCCLCVCLLGSSVSFHNCGTSEGFAGSFLAEASVCKFFKSHFWKNLSGSHGERTGNIFHEHLEHQVIINMADKSLTHHSPSETTTETESRYIYMSKCLEQFVGFKMHGFEE